MNHTTTVTPLGDHRPHPAHPASVGGIASLALGIALLLAQAATAATTPVQRCEAAKVLAAGHYAQCRLQADAAQAKRSDVPRRDAAYARCAAKLADAHDKAESSWGAACPTSGDEGDVQTYLGSTADKVRDWTDGLVAAPLTFERRTATGQTTCYLGGNDDTAPITANCAGTGQDGETQAGAPPSFADNGDGTITDLNTGLQWEKKSDDGSIHDKDARRLTNGVCSGNQSALCGRDSDCATLGGECLFDTAYELIDQLNLAGFAGHSDWRVPNARELESIATYGARTTNLVATPDVFDQGCTPGCSITTCSCTETSGYSTTSTTFGHAPLSGLFGTTLGIMTGASKTSYAMTRAVRGGSVAVDATSAAGGACSAARIGAQATFVQCRLKAEATYVKNLDATKRTAAVGKCAAKLADAYAKSTSSAGGACTTSGDAPSVRTFLESASDRVRDWSAGTSTGPLTFERLTRTGQDGCWLGVLIPVPCDGTGQDGDLKAGAPKSYSDGGDGTISDLNTGLQWEKKSDDGSLHDKDNAYPWVGKCTADARTWCTRDVDCRLLGGTCGGTTIFEWVDQLNASAFAGHADWRIPDARELASLIDQAPTSTAAPKIADAFNSLCGENSAGNSGCTVTQCSCTMPRSSGQFASYFTSTTLANPDAAYAAMGVDFGEGRLFGAQKTQPYSVRAVRGGL